MVPFLTSMALEQLGINPVKLTLDPDVGFLPSPKSCQELITPKTKAVMLVSPSNPTGAILPSQLLESLALLARRNRIAL